MVGVDDLGGRFFLFERERERGRKDIIEINSALLRMHAGMQKYEIRSFFPFSRFVT